METHSPLKLWDINDTKAKRIHLKIAEIMAPDYQLLSVVFNKDSPNFYTMELRYNIPSRKHFTESVAQDQE